MMVVISLARILWHCYCISGY